MTTSNNQEKEHLNEALESIIGRLNAFTYRCKCDADYTMLVMSGKVNDMTGYNLTDIIGNRVLSYAELIYADDSKHVDDAVDRGVKNRENWNVDYRIKMKDGNLIWVNEVGGCVYNENGELVYLEGIVSDISLRKKSEGQRRKEIEIVKHIVSNNKRVIDELQKLHYVGINAQIEAAHIGDKGKGFAIVAKEIRSLATATKLSAETIAKLIKDFDKLLKEQEQSQF